MLFWLGVIFAHFSCGSGKLTVSHIIAHRVVKFWAILIYLISLESYWYKLSHEIFCVGYEICLHFFWLGKIDRVSHFCPISTRILKCTTIFDISLKSLSMALTWIHNILFLLNTSCLGQSHTSATRVLYLSMWTPYGCFRASNLIGCFRFIQGSGRIDPCSELPHGGQ